MFPAGRRRKSRPPACLLISNAEGDRMGGKLDLALQESSR
jgi:hypothetical protein